MMLRDYCSVYFWCDNSVVCFKKEVLLEIQTEVLTCKYLLILYTYLYKILLLCVGLAGAGTNPVACGLVGFYYIILSAFVYV